MEAGLSNPQPLNEPGVFEPHYIFETSPPTMGRGTVHFDHTAKGKSRGSFSQGCQYLKANMGCA
jgi:hypothetical protein